MFIKVGENNKVINLKNVIKILCKNNYWILVTLKNWDVIPFYFEHYYNEKIRKEKFDDIICKIKNNCDCLLLKEYDKNYSYFILDKQFDDVLYFEEIDKWLDEELEIALNNEQNNYVLNYENYIYMNVSWKICKIDKKESYKINEIIKFYKF